MTTEKQNTTIAKVCGWKPTTDGGICWDHEGNPIITPPQYTRDLNAMHEAESRLPCGHWTRYCQYLADLGSWTVRFVSVHASAENRAKAFLKTLGLWEDDIPANVPRQVSLAGGAGGSNGSGAKALGLLCCQQALCLSGRMSDLCSSKLPTGQRLTARAC